MNDIISGELLVPVDIIIDSREAAKNPDIVEGIKKKGLRVAVITLNVGDYYLLATENKQPVLVERKTIIDLANSIKDNRVWEQVQLLREAAVKENAQPVLLLEGSFYSLTRYTKWNITSILRVLDEITLKYKVPILPSPNKNATIQWLVAKAKSLGETSKKRVIRLRVEKKPLTLNERILYVAEGLVGPVLARKLLEHFGTLRNIANASISELMKVEGIGEKRAREIYAIFNTRWRQ